jgi:hypothetical protein
MLDKLGIALAAAVMVGQAAAAPITPTYDTFGNLAGATFGGTGIPTDPTAITIIDDGNNNIITLGLTAHQRYSNPALANDGAGTFFAAAGANDGLDGGGHSVGATWNFAFYVNVDGGASLGRYDMRLYYDLDPAAGTELADMGYIVLSGAPGSILQDSQNATFGFLCGPDVPNVLQAPSAGCPFNPNAAGEYSFALIANEVTGAPLGTAAINVNIAAVPEPGTLALVGIALAGLAVTRRRS